MKKFQLLFILAATCLFYTTSATAQNNNVKVIRTSWPLVAPCLGEKVVGEVRFHIINMIDVNGKGNVNKYQINAQGGEFVGVTSGTVYKVTAFVDNLIHKIYDNGAYVFNHKLIINIKTSDGRNIRINAISHLTVNENGETTADISTSNVVCE